IGADVTGAYNRDFLSQDRLLVKLRGLPTDYNVAPERRLARTPTRAVGLPAQASAGGRDQSRPTRIWFQCPAWPAASQRPSSAPAWAPAGGTAMAESQGPFALSCSEPAHAYTASSDK